MSDLQFKITGPLIEWRGPAPFYFVAVSAADSRLIKAEAARVSYGWGVIPINGIVGTTEFYTALIPRDGVYLVPIKNVVRLPEGLVLGKKVTVEFTLGKK